MKVLVNAAAKTFVLGLLGIVATIGLAAPADQSGRRQTVGFTNGWSFGYFSLVVPSGSAITGFDKMAAGQQPPTISR